MSPLLNLCHVFDLILVQLFLLSALSVILVETAAAAATKLLVRSLVLPTHALFWLVDPLFVILLPALLLLGIILAADLPKRIGENALKKSASEISISRALKLPGAKVIKKNNAIVNAIANAIANASARPRRLQGKGAVGGGTGRLWMYGRRA